MVSTGAIYLCIKCADRTQSTQLNF